MKRRSTNKIILVALFISFLVSLSFSQQTIKIGVVNSQEVLEKSLEGKRVLKQLEEKSKKNQDELARLDEEIRKKETKLNTQRLTLTQEALMNLSSDIEKKKTERKRLSEDQYRDFQTFSGRLFTGIQNELLPVIEQIGKEKNFDIILDLGRSGAIYFNPAIDITQEVIKRYDASKATKK